jgi:hypothetical protein
MSEKDETLPIFAPRSEFTAEMSNSLFFNSFFLSIFAAEK